MSSQNNNSFKYESSTEKITGRPQDVYKFKKELAEQERKTKREEYIFLIVRRVLIGGGILGGGYGVIKLAVYLWRVFHQWLRKDNHGSLE